MVGGKRFVRAALLPFASRCLRNGSPNRAKTKYDPQAQTRREIRTVHVYIWTA